MERSIGFERTIKPANYESLKVTSYISGIPLEFWSDEQFVANLYNLMTAQAYKAVYNEVSLIESLHEHKGEELDELQKIEQELLQILNLDGIIVRTNLEKE